MKPDNYLTYGILLIFTVTSTATVKRRVPTPSAMRWQGCKTARKTANIVRKTLEVRIFVLLTGGQKPALNKESRC